VSRWYGRKGIIAAAGVEINEGKRTLKETKAIALRMK
jgi:hypothetical protein